MQKGGLLKHVGKLFVVGPPSLFVCLRELMSLLSVTLLIQSLKIITKSTIYVL
jgi:hypothetical protein